MIRPLDDKVLIAGQVRADEIAGLAAQGITLIINNRAEGEEPGQPLGAEIEEAARRAGLDYVSIPIIRGIGPADVTAMREALSGARGKVLAYCRSGMRSALVWALAQAEQGMPREEIERRLASVGVDPAPIAHLL